MALTKKGTLFCWESKEKAAFKQLKAIFILEPVLA
jgi:hypothetical protein